MSIIYRPAEYKDILKIAEVRTDATEEIKRRHGFDSKKAHNEPNPFYIFSLQKEPEGFWVAEEKGDILGMTISWVPGNLWFLSFLFVSPSHQDKNVGQNLLRMALQHGGEKKITNRAVLLLHITQRLSGSICNTGCTHGNLCTAWLVQVLQQHPSKVT